MHIWIGPMTILNVDSLVFSLPEQHEQDYNTMTDEDEFADLPDLVPLSDEDVFTDEEKKYEFGGKDMVIIGDLIQLPPISEWRNVKPLYDDA